jgi:hypothetical protein
VATFGAGASSANAGTAASTAWSLTNDATYKPGAYSSTVTYTISANMSRSRRVLGALCVCLGTIQVLAAGQKPHIANDHAVDAAVPAFAELAPAPNVATLVEAVVLAVCEPLQPVPGAATVQV